MKKDNMFKITKKLKSETFFVIPAYNEEKSISKVIKNLQKKEFNNLIIINDGSSDKTKDKVLENKKKGLIFLEHKKNKGQGAALRTGINYCIKNKRCKYIVTFDSDGQHRISDLKNLLEPLETGKCDIALGSRFLNKKTKKLVPLKKKILLKGGIIVTYLLSGKWFTDTHNGYRVMNKSAAKKIEIKMDGFEHASEILDDIAKKNIKYEEVPVYIDYTQYSKQKGQKITNSVRILYKMLRRKNE